MKNLYKLTLFPEIADRNLFSVDFVLLADLSQTHRISSGLRLRTTPYSVIPSLCSGQRLSSFLSF